MTKEPKEVRARRLREELDREGKKLQLATARGNWNDARVHAEKAADLETAVRAVEAEPEQTNVVGRPTVRDRPA